MLSSLPRLTTEKRTNSRVFRTTKSGISSEKAPTCMIFLTDCVRLLLKASPNADYFFISKVCSSLRNSRSLSLRPTSPLLTGEGEPFPVPHSAIPRLSFALVGYFTSNAKTFLPFFSFFSFDNDSSTDSITYNKIAGGNLFSAFSLIFS